MLRDAVVERDGAVSLHVQLRNAIAANIRAEKLAVGDRLPSERELQRQFELSRMTVRQALADLARSGMVYSKPGKGTFVAPRQVQRSWLASYLARLGPSVWFRGRFKAS